MADQRNMLDHYEQQKYTTSQRLMDAKKNTSEIVTADQMFTRLRNNTKKNRELCYEVLGRELQDKVERCQKIELVMPEPVTTQNDLDNGTNEVIGLQRECQILDDKLSSTNPPDPNLAIFSTQACAASKRKVNKLEEMNKLEKEKHALGQMMADKEAQYVKTKGTKYIKRDDFKQYETSLRGKHQKYKKMKKQLEEIRAELAVLSKTEQILNQNKANMTDDPMRKLEEQKETEGYGNNLDYMERVADDKLEVDKMKEKSEQEIKNIIENIQNQITEKKFKLAPVIKQLRIYRKIYEEKE
jgi:hypothetical protein